MPSNPFLCTLSALPNSMNAGRRAGFFSFTLVTGPRRSLSLKLSDTKVSPGYWVRVARGPHSSIAASWRLSWSHFVGIHRQILTNSRFDFFRAGFPWVLAAGGAGAARVDRRLALRCRLRPRPPRFPDRRASPVQWFRGGFVFEAHILLYHSA